MAELDLDELEQRLGRALGTTDIEARRELLAADMPELVAELRKLRGARAGLWEALDNATDQLDMFEIEGAAVANLRWLLDVLADNAPPEKAQRRRRQGVADA